MDDLAARIARHADPDNFMLTGQPPRSGFGVDELALHRTVKVITSAIKTSFDRFRVEVKEALDRRADANQIKADLEAVRADVDACERQLRAEVDAELLASRRPLEDEISGLRARLEALEHSSKGRRRSKAADQSAG